MDSGPSAKPYRPHPFKNEEHCYYDTDHDAADLCAQWRAAKAAERGVVVAGIGGFLSLLSVVLVMVALGQTRQANAIAAQAARDVIEKDKPSLVITLDSFEETGPVLSFVINATNVGGSGCVVTKVFQSWAGDVAPSTVMGKNDAIAIPSGETRQIDYASRGAITIERILYLRIGYEGPFLGDEAKWKLYRFYVFDGVASPHNMHYRVMGEKEGATERRKIEDIHPLDGPMRLARQRHA